MRCDFRPTHPSRWAAADRLDLGGTLEIVSFFFTARFVRKIQDSSHAHSDGARSWLRTRPHRFHGGLRSVAPTGTCKRKKMRTPLWPSRFNAKRPDWIGAFCVE